MEMEVLAVGVSRNRGHVGGPLIFQVFSGGRGGGSAEHHTAHPRPVLSVRTRPLEASQAVMVARGGRHEYAGSCG